MSTEPTLFDRVSCVRSSDAADLRAALRAAGFDVIELHGADVDDKASLFRQIAQDMPGRDDPPKRSWDALSDHVWQVVAARRADSIAIVWSDAHVVLQSSLATLLQFVGIVTDISRQAEVGEGGLPHATDLVLCLVGEGDAFDTFQQ